MEKKKLIPELDSREFNRKVLIEISNDNQSLFVDWTDDKIPHTKEFLIEKFGKEIKNTNFFSVVI
jgi:hypothetical protein